MRNINIKILKERGVSVDDIAQLSYWAQSKYLDSLTIEEMRESVLEILGKRDQFHAILLGVQIDVLAEKGMLDNPLLNILTHDLGLFGLDEAIAISIAGNYGQIGVTNFGNMDVNKPGKISLLQKDKNRCNCFLDDIVGAIAAVAAIRVAQRHAIAKATGQLNI
ncbi:phosphatidylglycerophosphatase A [bacterium]|nr:phosphatidylglycerophosphatase A [bacterium]